jgi:SAM-dependent methyltransferase
MGLARGAFKFLLAEAAERPFAGTVATLGRQDVSFTAEQMGAYAKELGVTLRTVDAELSRKPELRSRGLIADTTLLGALGFERSVVIDVSSYEDADLLFDLNEPEAPSELREAFDVILDPGTLEHVFHVPNALANLHAMLREGGRVIHLLPASNYMDHGFYMFSPTFFWDYYNANGWTVNTLRLFRHGLRSDRRRWRIYEYDPQTAHEVNFGSLDNARYGVCCVATKAQGATTGRVPQQGGYVRIWSAAGAADGASGRRRRLRGRLQRHALGRAAWNAALHAYPLVHNLPLTRLGVTSRPRLEPVDRY